MGFAPMAGIEPATSANVAALSRLKYPWPAPPAIWYCFVLVFVLVDVRTDEGCLSEAGTGLETDRLHRGCDDIDGQLLHLLPVRPVLVVVAGALVDDEGDNDVGMNFVCRSSRTRTPVTRHDVGVTAGLAQRGCADRGSALYVCFAHDASSFYPAQGWRVMAGGTGDSRTFRCSATELRKLMPAAGFEPATYAFQRSICYLRHRPNCCKSNARELPGNK